MLGVLLYVAPVLALIPIAVAYRLLDWWRDR